VRTLLNASTLIQRSPRPGRQYAVRRTPTGYAWAPVLKSLERAYGEQHEAEPLRPRWAGVAQRRNLDAVHRQLQAQRKQRIVEAVEP
jgi:hypothetical protein